MIPLYKPVKIALGVIFAIFTVGVITEGRAIVAVIFGLVSLLMFRSAYYHGKYEPRLFGRKTEIIASMNRFKVGDIVHNRQTNEDGKVTALREDGFYAVSVPNDQTSWMLGAVEAYWNDAGLEPSTNEALRQNQ